MEELAEVGFEVREELMVSLNGGAEPTKRLAHFLKPTTVNSIDGCVFELPDDCLSSLPSTFEPKRWPLTVNFHGWRSPQKDWKTWVGKMAALHRSTWKKTGIHEAIFNSTYEIRRNYDLVLGLAERWCPETKSFIFPWGEASITLEDVMIAGYSVLGSPVFSPLETDELKKIQEKLDQARAGFIRSASRKPDHGAWVKKFMNSGSEIEHEAFLSLWLSRFVFTSSSGVISKYVFPIATHLARGTRIALAPPVLASIYRDLGSLKGKIVALSDIDNWEDKDSKLAVTILSPFQLVQIWAWERFLGLRTEPNLIESGEARFARWHKIMHGVENARVFLDSTKDSYDWRPYTKTVKNWNLPRFYGEKERWVAVNACLSEELQSFAQCLRVSELVGIDCIEQYLPNRVAMQFGLDQDLPACVARANESPHIAWSYYSKCTSYANLYVPSRLYECGVSTRYLEWWKQSQERTLSSSKRMHKRSNEETKSSFPSFMKNLNKVKGFRKGVNSWVFKKESNRLKQAKLGKFITTSKMKPEGLDGMKNGGAASIHPDFSLKSSEKMLDGSKQKKRQIDASAACTCPGKKAKISAETSKEEKNVVHQSASDEFLRLHLEVKKEAGDSPVPPGFPPKHNSQKASETARDDSITIAEPSKLAKTGSPCLLVNKEANDSAVPPGFPPKSNLVKARETAQDDSITIAEPFKFAKNQSPCPAVNKEADESPVPPGFPPKSNLVKARETAQDDSITIAEPFKFAKYQSPCLAVNKEADDSPVPPGFPLKHNSLKASETAQDDSITIAEPSKLAKTGSPCLAVNKEADDSHVFPGFVTKSNLVGKSESAAKEDTLTVVELLKSRNKPNDFWEGGQAGTAENLPVQSEPFSSSGECENVEVIESQRESVQKLMLNEPMKDGVDMVKVDLTDSKACSPVHDEVRFHTDEADGNKYARGKPGSQLEEWVGRLEIIVAKLKAARFHHKSQS